MNNEFIKIYADFLKKFLKPPATGEARQWRQKKLKVVFDCSNGTAGPIIKKIFSNHKLLITNYLNNIPNGNFPAHGPNPLNKNAVGQLQKEIKKQKANLGIIFDADADRVFFIDNKNRIIDPEIIGRLLIWHLNPQKIIIGPSVGWTIKNLKDLKIINSKTGHSFIKKLMPEKKADFGFERSGHYYFPFQIDNKKIYYESGIFTAIKIINTVSKLPYSLTDFIDLSPKYFRSPEINIKLQSANCKAQDIIKKIEKYYTLKPKTHNLKTKNHLDGLTMEFDPPASGWWFNLRPSNTEPLIRLNIEAENKETLRKKTKEIISLIKN